MAEAESFNRILTLLRKERGITQKEAAASLGVSQALLSHYEKGIRECGLGFVVRAAEFYGVSCDYLLGLSPDRSGLTLSIEELPEGDASEDGHYRGSVLPTFNKKLLANSMAVLYDLLLKSPDKNLTGSVSSFLMTALYKMFRLIYSANPKNADSLFSVPAPLWSGYADAAMKVSEAKASAILSGEKISGLEPFEGADKLRLTSESLSEDYPQLATSLFNVIQQVEKEMQK